MPMECSVLTLDQAGDWKRHFQALPEAQRDVFFSPDYYALYRSMGQGEARCFVVADGEERFLYPFFQRDFSDLPFAQGIPGCDLEGAFGYNGAMSASRDPGFLEACARAFLEYCGKQQVVAEFTRFNPVYTNHTLSPWLDVSSPSQNVIVNLREEDIWMRSYEHAVRKNVNKATRLGVQVHYAPGGSVAAPDLKAFAGIYRATMDRNQAEERYYYDALYFTAIAAALPTNTLFFFATFEGALISCELVLHNRSSGYSFLGGTLADFYHLSPNVLLKHEIILALKAMGLDGFCLGGGSARGDGIFRYKSGFDKNGICDFFIGKRIHHQDIYDQLCGRWAAHHPGKVDRYKPYVLKYRY